MSGEEGGRGGLVKFVKTLKRSGRLFLDQTLIKVKANIEK